MADQTQLGDVDDLDERFIHGFDPIVFPPLVERLTRICSVVIGETPQAEQAKAVGDTGWRERETESMVTLLQETIRLRVTDLDPPVAPEGV